MARIGYVYVYSNYAGTIEEVDYSTPKYAAAGRYSKTMTVYLPYNYDPAEKYDVFILCPGLSGRRKWLQRTFYESGHTMNGQNVLDNMILGLNKSELILIAARPGMGKTSIALNIALSVAMTQRKKVAVFSLEMSREQLATRLLSRASLVPSTNLLTGQLSDQQWRDVAAAANTLSASEILIDDNPSLTVSDMNAQCRMVKDLDLVVIDYLQLMQSAGSGHSWSNESRTQAVSDISRMLKIMAKQLNVPVICLSQLSRANESRTDKRPMLSDLRESGAIEQDADVVIGLYRDGYYNRECENPNLAEAIVLKNRKGQTGTVNLTWVPEYTTFYSVEKYRDDEG